MSVEKGSDELWIAEKFQTNSEIAGSPRNSFRASLINESIGGKALNRRGVERLPTLIKLRIPNKLSVGVRLCEISLIVKRETAQIYS